MNRDMASRVGTYLGCRVLRMKEAKGVSSSGQHCASEENDPDTEEEHEEDDEGGGEK